MSKFTLKTSDKTLDLPVLEASDGPNTIDIRAIYKEINHFTFDPGFVATASCASKITYIDGDQGLLRYRGYPIEQLAELGNFPETAYLLMYGALPTTSQLATFNHSLCQYMPFANDGIPNLIKAFPQDAHPMAILIAALSFLAAQHHKEINIHDPDYREQSALRLIAQVATIVSAIFQHRHNKPPVAPRPEAEYTDNFLHMMSGASEDSPLNDIQKRDVFKRAMDVIFILHADHEQNASTSTVRMAGSTETNPYAALSAGVAALWGPAHGGANEAVIRMLEDIVSSGKPLSDYIARAKDKNDSFRLMGFGHRVYKNHDPRATIIRQICHDLLTTLEDDNPNRNLLQIAIELERVALEEEYFVSRKLYPNVDFYSGIIFRALGLPCDMFTAIFALARTSGWVSHWIEMLTDKSLRISRPRQLYIGESARAYLPISQRPTS